RQANVLETAQDQAQFLPESRPGLRLHQLNEIGNLADHIIISQDALHPFSPGVVFQPGAANGPGVPRWSHLLRETASAAGESVLHAAAALGGPSHRIPPGAPDRSARPRRFRRAKGWESSR